jgi:hypothetical protein
VASSVLNIKSGHASPCDAINCAAAARMSSGIEAASRFSRSKSTHLNSVLICNIAGRDIFQPITPAMPRESRPSEAVRSDEVSTGARVRIRRIANRTPKTAVLIASISAGSPSHMMHL